MIPSKYTEQKNLSTRALQQLIHNNKEKQQYNPKSYWDFKMPYGSDTSI